MKPIPQGSTPFDDKVTHFVHDNLRYIFIVIVVISAVVIRYLFAGFISGDTVKYFVPWAEHISNNGGFAGIATLESDYPVAYQYLLAITTFLPFSALSRIKIIVMFFDFCNAIMIMLLIKQLLKLSNQSLVPWMGFAISLFAPTVLLNTAIWGQCDNIYTFFLLLMLLFLLRERFLWAFVAYGLALSFKLQAVFLLPFLVFLYFRIRKFSLVNFLWVPITYFLVFIPALIVGKPINQLFEAYSLQVAEYPYMVLNLGNLYNLLPDDFAVLHIPALILTGIVLLTVYSYILFSPKLNFVDHKIIDVALLTVLTCVYFLPSMHERYLFSADIIAIVYLFLHPKRWILPLLIWVISQNGYAPVLWGFGPIFEPKLLALIWLGLIGYITLDIVNDTKQPSQEKSSTLSLPGTFD